LIAEKFPLTLTNPTGGVPVWGVHEPAEDKLIPRPLLLEREGARPFIPPLLSREGARG
jgi:hypothetical protein